MRPPLDVPRAPPRSSTDSTAMPRPKIAVLSNVVLTPGSPEASPGVGNGSPSVCSPSYLGISQPPGAPWRNQQPERDIERDRLGSRRGPQGGHGCACQGAGIDSNVI